MFVERTPKVKLPVIMVLKSGITETLISLSYEITRNQQHSIDVNMKETLLLKLLIHNFILKSTVLILKIPSIHVNRKECIHVSLFFV